MKITEKAKKKKKRRKLLPLKDAAPALNLLFLLLRAVPKNLDHALP